MIGFTPMETFDSTNIVLFGHNGFNGCGINLDSGSLYPVTTTQRLIDNEISKKAKEIIVILAISNNGQKKEIHFLLDGIESKTQDVSQIFSGIFRCNCDSLATTARATPKRIGSAPKRIG